MSVHSPEKSFNVNQNTRTDFSEASHTRKNPKPHSTLPCSVGVR
jgi:hypothetical protein